MAQPFAVNKEDAPSYWNVDILWTVLANSAQTGGDYSLMWELCPRDSGPGPHYHDQDEFVYVLKGDITFLVDGRRTSATAGGFVSIPRGAVHSFRVDSETAEILNGYTPGGFERTVEMSPKAESLTLPPKGMPMPMAREELMKVFKEVGMHIADEPDALRPDGKAVAS